MSRYKGTTVHEVHAIEEYLNWQRSKAKGSEYANCNTLKEWCGVDDSELPSKEVIDYYKQFYKECYSYWDIEHCYVPDVDITNFRVEYIDEVIDFVSFVIRAEGIAKNCGTYVDFIY